MKPLRWIHQIRKDKSPDKAWKKRWPSSVTQFVISAVGETDHELLSTTDYLYNQLYLKRTYFSSFNPIENTPLENVPPGSPVREHRLYEASFLLRDYGFAMEDLPFNQEGHLPQDVDPKLAWARDNLQHNPIEINTADKHMLLKVPGIGPKIVKALISERHEVKFSQPEDLLTIGLNLKRAAPFILVNGKSAAYQTSFL